MCIWKVGVLCVLMCLGNPQAQADNPAISMPDRDRVRVTLAGETVYFKLKVTIAINESLSDLVCSGPPDQKEFPFFFERTTGIHVIITAHNSSYSGEYNCKYKNAEIFWTLLVKDKGYRLPYSDFSHFIVLGALTTGLLIFSVIGSIYVFKSQWGQFTLKNRSTGSGVSRRNRGENEEEEEEEDSKTSVNAAASASVYSSLESRPASVYEVLAPAAAAAAAAAVVNRESVQRKEKVKRKKSKESMENATPQEDGIFECVYENY